MNYNNEMIKVIEGLESKPNLLLHSCCGPCSTSVIERLKDFFNITIYYYNPNIEPLEEYELRKSEQIRLLKELKIDYLDSEYDNDNFEELVKNNIKDRENGSRCVLCIKKRLENTALTASKNHFEYYCTTLTVSPHKNSVMINNIGMELETKYKVKFLLSDFKKEEGYKKSIELSKKYNLYRQNYCGCLYSIRGDINE